MAKTSMVQREIKRSALVRKHKSNREKLRVLISSPHTGDEDRINAEHQLQKLPRDSSYCRQRNRCRQCGRSRAYNRLTGLCRIHMRSAVMNGLVPGMHKASW